MPACHAGGHEFESRTHRQKFSRLECLPVTQEVTSSSLVRTAETLESSLENIQWAFYTK